MPDKPERFPLRLLKPVIDQGSASRNMLAVVESDEQRILHFAIVLRSARETFQHICIYLGDKQWVRTNQCALKDNKPLERRRIGRGKLLHLNCHLLFLRNTTPRTNHRC
jgi:hypothetical protein